MSKCEQQQQPTGKQLVDKGGTMNPRELAAVFNALGDPTAIKIIKALQKPRAPFSGKKIEGASKVSV